MHDIDMLAMTEAMVIIWVNASHRTYPTNWSFTLVQPVSKLRGQAVELFESTLAVKFLLGTDHQILSIYLCAVFNRI